MTMKKMTFSSLFILFLILSVTILAEAGTARFPVQIKWDASARGLVTTDIFILNLKNTPVDVYFAFYNEDGVKVNCSVMTWPITIPSNSTQHISPSGCFAIALGYPLDFEGIGLISASSNSISIYWRIYDQRVTPYELIDHGKEIPTGSSLKLTP
jgi:hypothetical protein